MNICDFEIEIKDKILNKGLKIFVNNSEGLSIESDDNYRVVIIDEDFDVFNVNIKLDENLDVITTKCSCNNKQLCGHVVAGLYSVREFIVSRQNNNHFNVLIDEYARKLDKNELMLILKEISNGDIYIKAKLLLKLLPKTTGDYISVIEKIIVSNKTSIEFLIDLNDYLYSEIKAFSDLEVVKFILTYLSFLNEFVNVYHKSSYQGFDSLEDVHELLLLLNIERYFYLLNSKVPLLDKNINLTSFINDIIVKYRKYLNNSYDFLNKLFKPVLEFSDYQTLNDLEKSIKIR